MRETQSSKLCDEGMVAHGEGRNDDAAENFKLAWEVSSDDYDACVAAHYVARHQSDHADALQWNQTALSHLQKIDDGSAAAFYPSLHASIARSHEELGDHESALSHYEAAALHLEALPSDAYGEFLKGTVTRGLKRVTKLES